MKLRLSLTTLFTIAIAASETPELKTAASLYVAGDLNAALKRTDAFLERAPADLEAQRLRGIILVELARYSEGAAQIEKLGEPTDATARYNLALASLYLGRQDFASVAARLEREPAAKPLRQMLRGHELLKAGRPLDAAAELAVAARMDAELPRVHYWLGFAYLLADRRREARTAFEQELSRSTSHVPTLYYLAFIENGSLYLDRAQEHIDRAIVLSPGSIPARMLQADILFKRGQTAEALPIAQAIVTKDPFDPEKRSLLARIYQRLGRAGDAAREFSAMERLKAER